MDIEAQDLTIQEARTVIGKFVRAMNGDDQNHLRWLECCLECRSAEAREAVEANLEVAKKDDLFGLLSRFASDCGAVSHACPALEKALARVSGLALSSPLAALAVVRQVEIQTARFLPALEIMAAKCSYRKPQPEVGEDADAAYTEAISAVLPLEIALHPAGQAAGEEVAQRAEEVCRLLFDEIFFVERPPMM
jgi:hypothetical protein